jgi:hypothetical protein
MSLDELISKSREKGSRKGLGERNRIQTEYIEPTSHQTTTAYNKPQPFIRFVAASSTLKKSKFDEEEDDNVLVIHLHEGDDLAKALKTTYSNYTLCNAWGKVKRVEMKCVATEVLEVDSAHIVSLDGGLVTLLSDTGEVVKGRLVKAKIATGGVRVRLKDASTKDLVVNEAFAQFTKQHSIVHAFGMLSKVQMEVEGQKKVLETCTMKHACTVIGLTPSGHLLIEHENGIIKGAKELIKCTVATEGVVLLFHKESLIL